MTSTTGTDPHPEVAEISALTEGLLPPERGADVRSHIADCALCADVLTSLEEIRGLLGTLPGPPRMPEDIAGRIDAALAAEAHLDANRPGVPRGTSVAAHVPRGTLTAPEGHAEAPTGPGRSGRGDGSGKGRGSSSGPARKGPGALRRNRRGLLTAATVLALSGVFYQVISSSGGGGANTDSSVSSAKRAMSSAAGGPVESQVRELLAGPTTGVKARTPMSEDHSDKAAPAPEAATAVPSCVLKATQRTQPPLAADRERFQGKAAYLLVLPHPGDAGSVDAFVVNASCTPASPGAILFQDTYPR